MKRMRNLFGLMVVVLVFIIAYIVFTNKTAIVFQGKNDIQNTKLEQESIKEVKRVLLVEQKDIVEIVLKNKNGKLVFEKNGDIWECIFPQNEEIRQMKVRNLAYNVSSLVIEKNLGNIEENRLEYFGFDKPSILTISAANGNTETIEIGDMTPTSSGYYIRRKDSSNIFIISMYAGEKLVAGIDYFNNGKW